MAPTGGQQPGKGCYIDPDRCVRVDLHALAGGEQPGRLLVLVEQVPETMERLAQVIVGAFRCVAWPKQLHQFTTRMNLPFHRQVDEQRSHLVRWNGGKWFTTERNLKLP